MIIQKKHGIYLSLQEAVENKRRNMFIPAADGRVYHLMENDILAVCSVAEQVPDLPVLKEGVRLKLPQKIEWSILQRFIAIARYYAYQHMTEVHGEVYWHLEKKCYRLYIPKQKVSIGNVTPESNFVVETGDTDWMKVMEIHSHHYWPAEPSSTDNANERETILYGIVGKLNQFFPEISVRTFFNGKHISIDPREVFEEPLFTWVRSLEQVEIVKGGEDDDTAAIVL